MATIKWDNRDWLTHHAWGSIHPDDQGVHYHEDQVQISDKKLLLHVEPNPKKFNIDGTDIISPVGGGLIYSIDKFGYGLYESRIKLSRGDDLINAFWIYTDDKYEYAEIDIMEAWSMKSNYFSFFWKQPFRWFRDELRAIWGDGMAHATPTRRGLPFRFINPSKQFINYGLLLTRDKIVFYRNYEIVKEIRDEEVLQGFRGKKFHVLINNLVTSGNEGLTGNERPLEALEFKFTPCRG